MESSVLALAPSVALALALAPSALALALGPVLSGLAVSIIFPTSNGSVIVTELVTIKHESAARRSFSSGRASLRRLAISDQNPPDLLPEPLDPEPGPLRLDILVLAPGPLALVPGPLVPGPLDLGDSILVPLVFSLTAVSLALAFVEYLILLTNGTNRGMAMVLAGPAHVHGRTNPGVTRRSMELNCYYANGKCLMRMRFEIENEIWIWICVLRFWCHWR